jgi:hypothetical protein
MGWMYGVDRDGKEIGYGVEDVCNHPECDEEIDRGLDYRCGGMESLSDPEAGCGGFFCGKHRHGFFSKCAACLKKPCLCDEPEDVGTDTCDQCFQPLRKTAV